MNARGALHLHFLPARSGIDIILIERHVKRIQNFRVQRDHCAQLLIVFVEKLLIFFRLLLAIHFQIFGGGNIDGDIAIDASAECFC